MSKTNRQGDKVQLRGSSKSRKQQQLDNDLVLSANPLTSQSDQEFENNAAANLGRGGFQPRLPTSLPPPGQQQQQPSPLPRRQPVPLMPPAQLHPGAPQVVAPAPAVPLQSPPPSELMDVDPSAGPPSQAVAVQPVLQPLSLGTPKESDTAAPCPAPTQQPSTQRQETLPLFVGPDAPSRPSRLAAEDESPSGKNRQQRASASVLGSPPHVGQQMFAGRSGAAVGAGRRAGIDFTTRMRPAGSDGAREGEGAGGGGKRGEKAARQYRPRPPCAPTTMFLQERRAPWQQRTTSAEQRRNDTRPTSSFASRSDNMYKPCQWLCRRCQQQQPR
ncbi:splicing factor, proline- and glutamine-rich-like [Schistocerca serialis cubense]|uniref:splicing factor, proline- and glutamine-rich-like n=1 Tax=Schistocerca serialis cubense TaxID=2023355 RepID=UPI00214E1A8D|nr:splicing factor, proline- and glutamine-rich-like [Schistocerca serialis cubense]